MKRFLLSSAMLIGASVYAQDHEQQITKALGGQSPYETGNLVTGSSNISGTGVAASSSAYGCFTHTTASSGPVVWENTLFALSTGIDSTHSYRIRVYQSGVYFVTYELYNSSGQKIDNFGSAFILLNGGDQAITSNIIPLSQGDTLDLLVYTSYQYARMTLYKIADIGATGNPVSTFNGIGPVVT